MSRIKSIIEYIKHVREKGNEVNRSGLYICFVLLAVYALVMSVVCFVKLDVVMGVVNIAIAVVMLLIIVVFTKIKSGRLLSWTVIAFIYALMFFFLYEGGVSGVSVLWLLFVPLGGMALINLYYGGILGILLGITVPIYMLTPLHNFGNQYAEEYRIRFPIIYSAFLLLTIFIFVRIERSEEEQKKFVREVIDADEAKSRFLASMSHEIRTPMNAIMGMCELTLNEELSDAVRENNENIYRSGKDLMHMINDLLDFSKVQSGKMELLCDSYKLSDVIKDVVYMTIARKGDKKLDFVVDCDPDIPNHLYGDEMRIKQIMVNILTNAVKYTEEGGFTLKLSCRRESYGINLIISVRDSGIGIREEDIGKVFNAYDRVNEESVHDIEGTGLGLPITKELVTLMDGVMVVQSKYGEGTEFRVTLPQKVLDETPILSDEKNKNTSILYCNREKMPEFAKDSYDNNLKKGLDRISENRCICQDVEELKREEATGNYTHILIGKSEYLQDSDYFEDLSNRCRVMVIQGRNQKMPVGDRIKTIHRPFYLRKVYEYLMEAESGHRGERKPDTFIAPDAHVLVVDDNALNLKVTVGHMKIYQMHIDTATSGMEALKMITMKKYDMVFMDHLMPEMDGIEAHRQIRLIEREYAEKIPVVALTANAVSDARDLFITEGFQGFLSKPIQAEQLKEVLLKWLNKDLIVCGKE